MTKMRLINLAGRQRMLTQQLIKLLLMKKFEVSSAYLEERIAKVKGEFEESLRILKESPENSREIEKQLKKVDGKWAAFIKSINEDKIEIVIEKNGDVLIEMDRAVNLYEKLNPRYTASLWRPPFEKTKKSS